jgi:hypothetical protein
MKKGFNPSCISPAEKARSIIKNDYFLKDGRFLDVVNSHRSRWFWEHSLPKPYSAYLRDELFLPCEHRDIISSNQKTTPGGKPLHTLYRGAKGFWKLTVLRSSVNDLTDFTISVLVGNKWRFYPAAIKREIVGHHGMDAYIQWRTQVLNDLDNLRFLIGEAQFDHYAYSVTCCESSERLCKRVGIHVQNGLAFLFPEKI